MTQRKRPQPQVEQQAAETESIPPVAGHEKTLELPPVAEPAAAIPAAAAAPPPPLTSPAPPPVSAPPPQTSPPATSPPAARPPRGPWLPTLVTLLLVGLVAAGGLLLWQRFGAGTTAASPGPANEPVAVPSTSVSSVDPSGGTGFREEGDATWRTQTYRTADFGNLKPGVGLLLDVGRPRRLSVVTFTAVTPGITVQLRAGDQETASTDGYQSVGGQQQASGNTSLAATSGGAHRYWLVWVTRLAAADGGFRAEIRDPVALATG